MASWRRPTARPIPIARDVVLIGPNQLWVADITYIAITTGFVYLAAILDAWSRRVVGYAMSSRETRHPAASNHSDLGSQYASAVYRKMLADHGLVGSMSRRGNPYANDKAESFDEDAQGRPSCTALNIARFLMTVDGRSLVVALVQAKLSPLSPGT